MHVGGPVVPQELTRCLACAASALINPCGLAAWSYFNDTFAFTPQSTGCAANPQRSLLGFALVSRASILMRLLTRLLSPAARR
jgi:hypothetical protein